MESRITASAAVRNLSDIFDRVKHHGEVFIVQRHGKDMCRIVPADHPVEWKSAVELADSWSRRIPDEDS